MQENICTCTTCRHICIHGMEMCTRNYQFMGCLIGFIVMLGPMEDSAVICEKVLMSVTTTINSPSHLLGLSAISGALVERGHTVVLCTSEAKGAEGFQNGTISYPIFYKVSYTKEDLKEKRKLFTELAKSKGIFAFVRKFTTLQEIMSEGCVQLWKDEETLQMLKSESFDLMLSFPFNPCDCLLSRYIGIPRVVYTPSIRIPTFHESLIGMSAPSSYVPYPTFSTLTDEMSFGQRLKNLVFPIFLDIKDWMGNSVYRQIKSEFSIAPGQSIGELQSDALLWLSHTDFAVDFPRPFSPNWIPVGGIASRPAKELPKDLEEFVEGSGEHGVIIFSLGSAVAAELEDDFMDTIASVFSKLPQRILWKRDTEDQSRVGKNTKLVDWLPQNDLLGHPKTCLLIYHGGSHGVMEAIYHGVPMVIIPLFGDQFAHAARVQKKGMGLMLDKSNLTEASIMEAIREVIDNPRYVDRVRHFSSIHHDAPLEPLERAVYWIEHVMKFGGDHLRPRSADMNFIELYMIDVTLFLSCLSIFLIYVQLLILRKCYRCICGRSSANKVKNE